MVGKLTGTTLLSVFVQIGLHKDLQKSFDSVGRSDRTDSDPEDAAKRRRKEAAQSDAAPTDPGEMDEEV